MVRNKRQSSPVLVPFDGSRNALRAVDRAIVEATLSGSRVDLVHVQPPPNEYGMVSSYSQSTAVRNLVNQRSRHIMRSAGKKLDRAHVEHKLHIAHGDIAPSIVRTARRLGCGSIVMGTRGSGPIASLVLGSVARGVVHLSNIPVTLVK